MEIQKMTYSRPNTWKNGIILLLMLFFTNFISYRGYHGLSRGVYFVIVYVILFLLIFNSRKIKNNFMGSSVKLTIISILLSCIPSVLIFEQGFYDALCGIQTYLFPVFLYYILHIWKIEEIVVFKFLIGFTFAFGFFEVIQQFTFPVYWFNGRAADELTGLLEERMGFWRFYLFGIDYCLLAIMMCFGKILNKDGKQTTNYLYFVICAVAIYFFLARKDIYAVVSCLVIGTLFYTKKGNIWSKAFIVALLFCAYAFLSNSMLELNEQTQTEMVESREDFIRFVGADYFINSFSNSPLYYLFGSGIPGGKNYLSSLISYLTENMRIYQDDCGFVGYFSKFGLFGLLVQVGILIKIARNYKYIDISLLMFALLQLEISFFDFWGNNTRNMAAWAIFLYLIDKNVANNKIAMGYNGKGF